jgi:hypothetical protein
MSATRCSATATRSSCHRAWRDVTDPKLPPCLALSSLISLATTSNLAPASICAIRAVTGADQLNRGRRVRPSQADLAGGRDARLTLALASSILLCFSQLQVLEAKEVSGCWGCGLQPTDGGAGVRSCRGEGAELTECAAAATGSRPVSASTTRGLNEAAGLP